MHAPKAGNFPERRINIWGSRLKGKRGTSIRAECFIQTRHFSSSCRTTCRLNIKFFPYDQQVRRREDTKKKRCQNCTLVISSWTSSKSDLDYVAEFPSVNLDNFIPNEEWTVISFNIRRVEVLSLSPSSLVGERERALIWHGVASVRPEERERQRGLRTTALERGGRETKRDEAGASTTHSNN